MVFFMILDSAFTERVLGAPADNFKGYVEADLTQRARLVPSNSLYLLHGLADLTAPYTHGVAFAKAMSEAGVIFRYQVIFFIFEFIQKGVKNFFAFIIFLE